RTAYGPGVAIENVEGLHNAIALLLVNHKPRLSGAEFRFLRKELDMSQARLAHVLGNDAQSVALWEKRGRVPKWADRFLRALYREHAQGNANIIELVNRLNDMDQAEFRKMRFEETGKGWQPKAA
ncbi:MAG: helix-turn-helix domain-containing protein, partial [Stellaceae bacterium]